MLLKTIMRWKVIHLIRIWWAQMRVNDKKIEIKSAEVRKSSQDKPEPYPLRGSLEGCPPTSHGLSIMPSYNGEIVAGNRGVPRLHSGEVARDVTKSTK